MKQEWYREMYHYSTGVLRRCEKLLIALRAKTNSRKTLQSVNVLEDNVTCN
jgi:hypothetical protein